MQNVRVINPVEAQLVWMCFVDGENLAIRAREVAEAAGVHLANGPWYRRDIFAWFPGMGAGQPFIVPAARAAPPWALRSYYYTSVSGNGVDDEVKQALWNLGFDPQVFQKTKGDRRKGVDISLTKDMLSHAFRGNYDVALLFAGDGDYAPLVDEVKRLGKVVHLCFFQNGLNQALRLGADHFTDITGQFLQQWRSVSAYKPPVRR